MQGRLVRDSVSILVLSTRSCLECNLVQDPVGALRFTDVALFYFDGTLKYCVRGEEGVGGRRAEGRRPGWDKNWGMGGASRRGGGGRGRTLPDTRLLDAGSCGRAYIDTPGLLPVENSLAMLSVGESGHPHDIAAPASIHCVLFVFVFKKDTALHATVTVVHAAFVVLAYIYDLIVGPEDSVAFATFDGVGV